MWSRLEPTVGVFHAEELASHRGRTAYSADDDYVFCHPQRGSSLDYARCAVTLRAALAKACVTKHVRPFHDAGRHTGITHDAATVTKPIGLQKRAGILTTA